MKGAFDSLNIQRFGENKFGKCVDILESGLYICVGYLKLKHSCLLSPNVQKIYAPCTLRPFVRVYRGHFTLGTCPLRMSK